jgi:ParB family transcriptional regulator, chromosome partitioning protein
MRLNDLLAAEAARAPIGQATHLPLEKILLRIEDTRPINLKHAGDIAESIAAIGLINAIAVDNQGRLLAGGHRRYAITYLLSPEAIAQWFPIGIPVRMFDFDATVDPEKALAVEASENERRLNYTPAEVRKLADRLTAQGYRRAAGKPKKGEKALTPALALIFGVSTRTIERHLNPQTPTPVGVSTQIAKLQRDLTRIAILDGVPDKLAKECMKLARQIADERV